MVKMRNQFSCRMLCIFPFFWQMKNEECRMKFALLMGDWYVCDLNRNDGMTHAWLNHSNEQMNESHLNFGPLLASFS